MTLTIPSADMAVAEIVARLALIPEHDAMDGTPADTIPPRRYYCVYDQTGATPRGKYSGDPQSLLLPLQVSCVARTHAGLRESVQWAREMLLMWAPIPTATPLVEDGSGPVLSDGLGDDRRLAAPLLLHCYLLREPI